MKTFSVVLEDINWYYENPDAPSSFSLVTQARNVYHAENITIDTAERASGICMVRWRSSVVEVEPMVD